MHFNDTKNHSEVFVSSIYYEIFLYNNAFFENLVGEFYRINKYKSNIYRKIKNEQEYFTKLSNEERLILEDLTKKEKKLLDEILKHKLIENNTTNSK
jgi:hypothetical protein